MKIAIQPRKGEGTAKRNMDHELHVYVYIEVFLEMYDNSCFALCLDLKERSDI